MSSESVTSGTAADAATAGEPSPELAALQAALAEKLPPAVAHIADAADADALEALRIEYLGQNGMLRDFNNRLGALRPAERPIAGKLLNNLKKDLVQAYNDRKAALESQALARALEKESVDVSLPGVRPDSGHEHPIIKVTREIEQIFRDMGFRVETGPEVENDWFNFEALNFPADHPARDMQDTFYTDRGHLLRTHTSPTQLRAMMTIPPPLAVITTGRVYRCDADTTHSPMFHQMEGLLIDRNVSMAHLKGVLMEFLRRFYGADVEMRLRPSFFPFTEPSAEVDIRASFSKGGWMEVLGCGLVHPNVFRSAGLDPKEWTGFAFGLGIDRLAMIKYGINDISLLTRNDIRFLRQF